MWFTSNLADRTARAVLRCMPILIVALFLPPPYKLALPASGLVFGAFLISTFLASLLAVAFCMLVYISAFYTLSPMGVRIVATSLVEFFTGAIIPLPFFPDNFRGIAELLPFAFMQNIPLRIYSGNISGMTAVADIGFQVLWIIVLVTIGTVWMKHALKRVVLQGG
jgi:ABC-2 type transport system permease protein